MPLPVSPDASSASADSLFRTLAADLAAGQPTLWTRRAAPSLGASAPGDAPHPQQMRAARDRLARHAPALAHWFEVLRATGGEVESPLLDGQALAPAVGLPAGSGSLWIKADHLLPVAGSVKARGGMHEVLELAERLALQHGLLHAQELADATPTARLAAAPLRALFAQHTIAVGSTGNLGLSIGVVAAALGFRAVVHMSADAKAWKKDRLRAHGVEVVEHAGDYAEAVAVGRAQAQADPWCHFVDDERSQSLLLGYSAAAFHLARQLAAQGRAVDAEHPLLVYLPCGVGGAPAGIAWGLRQVLGEHVHCFFAEPVQSPCFLVEMLAGEAVFPPRAGAAVSGRPPTVYDWGLSNRTEADGLAVPQASQLAAGLMRPELAGVYTVEDDQLFAMVAQVLDALGERIEPSAAAGLGGPAMLTQSPQGQAWLSASGVGTALAGATHLVWSTGGSLVPDAVFAGFVERGRSVLSRRGDRGAGRSVG